MLGPRREYRKGWAVQTVLAGHPGRYVKIWRKVDGAWSVVDRALNQRAAMRRVRAIIECERASDA